MAFLLFLFLNFVSATTLRSRQKEIGHYNIKIKDVETKSEVEKTFFLYTNENPSLQAKYFCEENDIHKDGTYAV